LSLRDAATTRGLRRKIFGPAGIDKAGAAQHGENLLARNYFYNLSRSRERLSDLKRLARLGASKPSLLRGLMAARSCEAWNMLVGHLGAGLAAKAVAPRVGLGTLVAAALLLDIVLWLFVILHLEGAVVPGDYAQTHQLAFSFPWSHSLLGALFWSGAAAFVWTWSGGAGKYFAFAPAVIAATAFSHWVLDYLSHPGEMPLWGPGAPSVGLGLGQTPSLIIELVIAAAGLGVFLWRTRLSIPRRAAIVGLVLATATLTVFGAVNTAPPGDILTVAGLSLLAMFAIVTIAAMADRETR
jgi:hypothetical protein